MLKKEKKLPTLVDIARKCKMSVPKVSASGGDENSTKIIDKARIEKEFSQTLKVLFGMKTGGMDEYAQYLRQHVRLSKPCKSAISSKKVEMCTSVLFRIDMPQDRIICKDEATEIGEKCNIGKEGVLEITLKNANEKIAGIAFFDVDFWIGENSNIIECVVMAESTDCYKAAGMVYSKNCAFTFWPVNSSNCFGCDTIFHSSMCVNCYHSVKLSRCFEMDSCRDCADCMFCHNIENCQECLFCFNIKAKRYAIGNVEYPKEEYLKIKKMVLDEIADKLEKEKKLGINIFNAGCKK